MPKKSSIIDSLEIDPELSLKLKEMIENGRTQFNIAEDLGISQSTVSRIIKKMGYTRQYTKAGSALKEVTFSS